MKRFRKFAQLLKVIWVEDIQYWVYWNTIGKWRVDKAIKEGRCLRCGNKLTSDYCNECVCHKFI